MLKKMLVFDPRKRITAAEALQHEYLLALHDVNDEPDSAVFDSSFESDKVTEQDLRALIWEEVRNYHPSLGPVVLLGDAFVSKPPKLPARFRTYFHMCFLFFGVFRFCFNVFSSFLSCFLVEF